MRVTWEIEDGYVGRSRPHYTEVPDDELDECETDEEMEHIIEEYVQTDFDNSISWTITHRDS